MKNLWIYLSPTLQLLLKHFFLCVLLKVYHLLILFYLFWVLSHLQDLSMLPFSGLTEFVSLFYSSWLTYLGSLLYLLTILLTDLFHPVCYDTITKATITCSLNSLNLCYKFLFCYLYFCSSCYTLNNRLILFSIWPYIYAILTINCSLTCKYLNFYLFRFVSNLILNHSQILKTILCILKDRWIDFQL